MFGSYFSFCFVAISNSERSIHTYALAISYTLLSRQQREERIAQMNYIMQIQVMDVRRGGNHIEHIFSISMCA